MNKKILLSIIIFLTNYKKFVIMGLIFFLFIGNVNAYSPFSHTSSLLPSQINYSLDIITPSISVNDSKIWLTSIQYFKEYYLNGTAVNGLSFDTSSYGIPIAFDAIYNNGTNIFIIGSNQNLVNIFYFNGTRQATNSLIGCGVSANFKSITSNGTSYFIGSVNKIASYYHNFTCYDSINITGITGNALTLFNNTFYFVSSTTNGIVNISLFNGTITGKYFHYNATFYNALNDFVISPNNVSYGVYTAQSKFIELGKHGLDIINASNPTAQAISYDSGFITYNISFASTGSTNYTIDLPVMPTSTPTSISCNYYTYPTSNIITYTNTSSSCRLQVNNTNLQSNSYLSTNPLSIDTGIALVVQTGACQEKAYNFTILDEENLTKIYNATINYNFKFGLGIDENLTAYNSYGQLSLGNSNTFNVCINSTQSLGWVIGTGELNYYTPNFVTRRYYIFDNRKITNNTENVTLYELLNSRQRSFRLVAKDTSLNPFVNKFTALFRWYPNLDKYDIVEMGLTDSEGANVLHVVSEDVEYRIALYERNGTLIKFDDKKIFVCLQDPCTYELKVDTQNFSTTNIFKISGSLTYNKSNSIWKYVYSDPTQSTQLMNLTIYRDTGRITTMICSNSVSGFAGVITCDTSSVTTGTLRGVVTRTASPPIPIDQLIIPLGSFTLKQPVYLFIFFLISAGLTLLFAQTGNPILTIIGTIMGLVVSVVFGNIQIAILYGFIGIGLFLYSVAKKVS